MNDTKHLHQRYRTWWARLRTPLAVRRLHPDQPQFVWRNLKTRDLKEAQRLRHAAIAEQQAQWERLLRDRPAQPEEIERLAAVEMHRYYGELAVQSLAISEELDDLHSQAGADLAMSRLDPIAETMLRQQGFTLDDDLKWISDPRGTHSEYHWARRIGPALQFLFPGDRRPIRLEERIEASIPDAARR